MNKVITVIGRRWFEKVNGNTYHSCEVFVDGDLVERVAFTYGYGDHYQQTALEILYKHGIYTPPEGQKYTESFWRAVERNGDKKIISCTDVQRKKDL